MMSARPTCGGRVQRPGSVGSTPRPSQAQGLLAQAPGTIHQARQITSHRTYLIKDRQAHPDPDPDQQAHPDPDQQAHPDPSRQAHPDPDPDQQAHPDPSRQVHPDPSQQGQLGNLHRNRWMILIRGCGSLAMMSAEHAGYRPAPYSAQHRMRDEPAL